MASNNPDAPVCPKCGVSNGISVEVSGSIRWSRGAWRWCIDPEQTDFDGTVFCSKCEHTSNDIAEFYDAA